MNLSNDLYKNIPAMKVILRVLKAKGRPRKGLDDAIANVRKDLPVAVLSEFDTLIKTINFSFNYDNIRLKAIHNQRSNDPDRRAARVLSFLENNPNHPLAKGTR